MFKTESESSDLVHSFYTYVEKKEPTVQFQVKSYLLSIFFPLLCITRSLFPVVSSCFPVHTEMMRQKETVKSSLLSFSRLKNRNTINIICEESRGTDSSVLASLFSFSITSTSHYVSVSRSSGVNVLLDANEEPRLIGDAAVEALQHI